MSGRRGIPPRGTSTETTMDLSDPTTFARVYDEHVRGVHGAAFRILGNATLAQDVTQDVFLKVWRRPAAFDARRGELGSYLRLMARSRALDLWREQQAAGRASDRLKVVVSGDGGPARRPPGADGRARGRARDDARRAARRCPDSQREAVVLAYWARDDGRRDRAPLGRAARHRQEPHPARAHEAAQRARRARGPPPRPRERRSRRVGSRAMPVTGSNGDPRLEPLYASERPANDGIDWFDAHTHMGENDPDGRAATAQEIVEALDRAGQQRALIFAMHEPDGYPGPNDAVLAACAASARAPAAARRGSTPTATRSPRRGAAWPPARAASSSIRAATPSRCPTRASSRSSQIAHELRMPVLFHAGRGIPHLGDAVVDYARRYPGARLILAHAGISDLGRARRRGGASCRTCSSTPPGGRSPTSSSSTRRSRPGRSCTPATRRTGRRPTPAG